MTWTMQQIAEDFWQHVDRRGPDDCWPWLGTHNQFGYGRFVRRGKCNVVAHRVAYELSVSPIPEGLDLDHLCRHRGCVNPHHLEPVTRSVNMKRAFAAAVYEFEGIRV